MLSSSIGERERERESVPAGGTEGHSDIGGDASSERRQHLLFSDDSPSRMFQPLARRGCSGARRKACAASLRVSAHHQSEQRERSFESPGFQRAAALWRAFRGFCRATKATRASCAKHSNRTSSRSPPRVCNSRLRLSFRDQSADWSWESPGDCNTWGDCHGSLRSLAMTAFFRALL